MQAEYPWISSARVWGRHVELEHSQSPLLSLTLQHSGRVGVVVQYSASQLQDFTGLLYQDQHSTLHLNLSLVGAAGTLAGEVEAAGTSQASTTNMAGLLRTRSALAVLIIQINKCD